MLSRFRSKSGRSLRLLHKPCSPVRRSFGTYARQSALPPLPSDVTVASPRSRSDPLSPARPVSHTYHDDVSMFWNHRVRLHNHPACLDIHPWIVVSVDELSCGEACRVFCKEVGEPRLCGPRRRRRRRKFVDGHLGRREGCGCLRMRTAGVNEPGERGSSPAAASFTVRAGCTTPRSTYPTRTRPPRRHKWGMGK